jgi:RNA polymerase sigma-70 factor (ECF subfamily)
MSAELVMGSTTSAVEDRLALRCRDGDSSAFDELVSRYQLRLYRFAYRMLRDRSEAEDAVQEAFVRVYRALPNYRPDGFFSSWVYRITLNECRRRIRSKKPTMPLEYAQGVVGGEDPQNAIIAGERNRQLRLAVDSLPETYRLVMIMFYFEELSVEQVSKALGLSISAVKVRLHRGRSRLMNKLNPDLA